MRSLSIAIFAAALLLPPLASAQIGVSINIGQPGYYGRIELGDYPQPQLIYAEPRIIRRVQTVRSPIYLRVPPGHARNWGKHCSRYNACSRPVYFVDDGWYERTYVPAYQERHGRKNKGDDRHDGDGHHDDGDRGHGNKGGKGNHGKGHGKN